MTIAIASILLGLAHSTDFVVDGERLLLAAIPLYLFAAWACGAYRLDVLQHTSSSVFRAVVALALAVFLSLLVARTFGLGTGASGVGITLPLAAAALGLAALRGALVVWLRHNGSKLAPDIILLGDQSVRSNHERDAVTEIDVRSCNWRPQTDDPDFLDNLSRTVGSADRIVLSFQTTEERYRWSRMMSDIGLRVELLEPHLAELRPLALEYVGTTPTLVVSRGVLTPVERALKRALDLVLVILALPIVMPLMSVLAVLIRLDSPGPILFVQRRIGTNNRYFNCLKFRTMRADLADQGGNHLTERNDPRITRIGSFLRRSSFDELPQLWNVLRGEMSLVGPRPHALGASADGALYWEAVASYWRRHSVKPGLTGLAQIRGYRGPTETRSEIENRVAADLEYINSWSLWLDLKILFRTLRVLVHHNAF
ncbi:exopolysaccharide biosynthesis polyprenyl glycosylphosphotransferase [Nitratireductor sp. ZSWI3]|uniref:exopolysaccharide biosynthesis polyprenyl glycosylphosphotransferase n=1 Tax=Nitratireductor sp. ZSWI3 TaxID=2966359 RepID=UPI00214FBCCD|nr:exopolysaccharide biosynthesis polyprenyl glycosylphosphotransferase [Nitratireductor sp. ZSWI3]MCR4267840.1 exopolysaccharide biosynthesis polyprenyl glycosylphosphotransferase [Nitratireductor sp. ZSWI3]